MQSNLFLNSMFTTHCFILLLEFLGYVLDHFVCVKHNCALHYTRIQITLICDEVYDSMHAIKELCSCSIYIPGNCHLSLRKMATIQCKSPVLPDVDIQINTLKYDYHNPQVQ